MEKPVLIFLFIILISGCEKDNNTCDCKDPLMELGWLKDLKESLTNCYCEISIIQATYKKQTVFYSAMTDPRCDGIINITIADCKGNVLKTYTALDDTFAYEVTDRKVIYRCGTN